MGRVLERTPTVTQIGFDVMEAASIIGLTQTGGGSGMTTTNTQSGTNVHEVAEGIFRINTPVPPSVIPGGFSFNQFLLVSDEPLLFHSGPRKMFPLVLEAVASVLPDWAFKG